jgi:hypothetical protein
VTGRPNAARRKGSNYEPAAPGMLETCVMMLP